LLNIPDTVWKRRSSKDIEEMQHYELKDVVLKHYEVCIASLLAAHGCRFLAACLTCNGSNDRER
jgi:hypothetical protein